MMFDEPKELVGMKGMFFGFLAMERDSKLGKDERNCHGISVMLLQCFQSIGRVADNKIC